MIQHLFNNLLWFLTGGQSDFFPLFKGFHPWVLVAKYGGVNVAPTMEIFIAVCLLGAAIYVALTIRDILSRRWFRAAISLVVSIALTTAAYAASSTLSNLTAASSVSGTDTYYTVQTPGTGGVKVTAAQLLTYILANIPGGTVTSVSASCGNTTGTGAITTAGTITAVLIEDYENGANFPILPTDCGKVVKLSNASGQTPTIPGAGTTGFLAGWSTTICNGAAGVQTLTPASGTIAGLSSYAIAAGTDSAPTCIAIYSGTHVGTNDYGVVTGAAAGGGSGTITAGSTVTASITSGDIMSSTSNLVADSGIAVSNVALLSGTQTLTGNKTFSGVATFAEVIGGTRTVSTGTTDTLLVTDCGKTVIYSSTSAVTVTVASATFAAGCNANILQTGSNKVTISGSGVTVTSASSFTGTSGTAGAMIGLFFSSSSQAYLTGQGS